MGTRKHSQSNPTPTKQRLAIHSRLQHPTRKRMFFKKSPIFKRNGEQKWWHSQHRIGASTIRWAEYTKTHHFAQISHLRHTTNKCDNLSTIFGFGASRSPYAVTNTAHGRPPSTLTKSPRIIDKNNYAQNPSSSRRITENRKLKINPHPTSNIDSFRCYFHSGIRISTPNIGHTFLDAINTTIYCDLALSGKISCGHSR